MTQQELGVNSDIVSTVMERIKKREMSIPIQYELTIHMYNCPKNPGLPDLTTFTSVPSLKMLIHKAMAKRRACECDLAFLQDILTKPKCPE